MSYRVIFTGGPGSGKTSLIEYLNQIGYQSTPEVGRKVIQEQMRANGTALPWLDKTAFRDQMILEEIYNYENFGQSTTTFYDRSIIDTYGYSRLEQISVPKSLLTKCHELVYCKKVFIFPPWEEIYENDIERKQDFSTAVATYEEMVSAYHKFGYELIEVPRGSIKERAEFIINKLDNG